MLLEEVGGWMPPIMRTLKNGMDTLPQAFMRDTSDPYSLENDVHYGITVTNVEWRQPGKDKCSYRVKVSGRQIQTGNEVNFGADAVIFTVSLTVMRQVEFRPPLPQQVLDAFGSIHYEHAVKVFLGFRERFWEKGEFPIVNGGISFTDLPICEIVYPSKRNGKSKRGILMFYFKNREAQELKSLSINAIVIECLREIQTVYQGLLGKNASKITELFEVGVVKNWNRDSTEEGGWVHLLPYSYMNNLRALLEPKQIRPIFLGGDAISFGSGWIQGALESGLRSAWQFFKFNEYVLIFILLYNFIFTFLLTLDDFLFKKFKWAFVMSTKIQ